MSTPREILEALLNLDELTPAELDWLCGGEFSSFYRLNLLQTKTPLVLCQVTEIPTFISFSLY
jgi:hypothetical protein